MKRINKMNFNAVLDISSIIWDKADYDANTQRYYILAKCISALLEKLEKEKPKILLRNELLVEMTNGFPFESLPNHFIDFGNDVYSFLGNVGSNMIQYPDRIIPDIVSIPNLIKAHYHNTTKNEVNYLISKIHTDSESKNVYFTFEYLWNGVDKLKTKVAGDVKKYETIISDNENKLENFFAKYKLIFKHNPKHNKSPNKTREAWEQTANKHGFISQLSCYRGNNKKPQEIFNARYRKKIGGCYYSYDSENDVYVIFRITQVNSNIYHGYDEYEIKNIPNKIKKQFNIWKYKWN